MGNVTENALYVILCIICLTIYYCYSFIFFNLPAYCCYFIDFVILLSDNTL